MENETRKGSDSPVADTNGIGIDSNAYASSSISNVAQAAPEVNTEHMQNGGENAAAYGNLAPLQVNSVDDAQNTAYNRRNGGVLDAGSEYGAENAGDRVPRVQMPVGEMAGRGTDGRGNPGISGLELGPESGTRETLDGQGVVNLGLQDSSSDSALFASALDAAKASNEHGAFVDSQDAETLNREGASTRSMRQRAKPPEFYLLFSRGYAIIKKWE